MSSLWIFFIFLFVWWNVILVHTEIQERRRKKKTVIFILQTENTYRYSLYTQIPTHAHTHTWPQLAFLSIIHLVAYSSLIFCSCLQGSLTREQNMDVYTCCNVHASVPSEVRKWEAWRGMGEGDWEGGGMEEDSVWWMWSGMLHYGTITRVIKTTPWVSSGLGRWEEWRQPITIC